jgi:hypothetical protein
MDVSQILASAGLLLRNIDALLKFSDALLDKFLSVLGK